MHSSFPRRLPRSDTGQVENNAAGMEGTLVHRESALGGEMSKKKPFVICYQYVESDMIPSHGPQGSPSPVRREKYATLKEAREAKRRLEKSGRFYGYLTIEVIRDDQTL